MQIRMIEEAVTKILSSIWTNCEIAAEIHGSREFDLRADQFPNVVSSLFCRLLP